MNTDLQCRADQLWSTLFNIHNQGKSKEEQIEIITLILAETANDYLKKGRKQIINEFKTKLTEYES